MAYSSGDESKRQPIAGDLLASDDDRSSDEAPAPGKSFLNLPSSFCWSQAGTFVLGKKDIFKDALEEDSRSPSPSPQPTHVVKEPKERNRSPVPQSSEFIDLTTPFRQKLMTNCLTAWKACVLNDPDMWVTWKNILAKCMDTIWVDINYEVERRIMNTLSGIGEENPDDVEGPSPTGYIMNRHWLRIRAFALHHYLAHNRSFFGKLNDFVFIIMLVVTMVPIGGLRVLFFTIILFMLRFPGPPDEFQLVNYILVFKGTQFVTSGFAGLASGAMRYFMCYTLFKEGFLECVEKHGPSSKVSSGHIFNYLGSVVLVWMAFSVLPMSTQRGVGNDKPSKGTDKPANVADTWEKLRWLLYYDMACFTLSIFVLGMLSMVHMIVCYATEKSMDEVTAERQFHANIFWCNVLYSILSLPFLVMKWLPGALAVLTHTTVTGYNTHGACVAFGFGSRKFAEPSTQSGPKPGPPAWTAGFAARNVTRVLRLAARGRQARGRGQSSSGEFQVTDVVAGMFSAPVGLWTKLRRDREVRNARGAERTMSPMSSPREDTVAEQPPNSRRRRDPQKFSFLRNRRGQKGGSADGLSVAASDEDLLMRSANQLHEPLELRSPERDPLVLTNISLPSCSIQQNPEGKTMFTVEVTREDGSCTRILRRYAEFRELFVRLGRQAYDVATVVTFPPRLLVACSGARLESRRASLENWLNAVVFHYMSDQDDVWCGYLREFLEEDVHNFFDVVPCEALQSSSTVDFYGPGRRSPLGAGMSSDSEMLDQVDGTCLPDIAVAESSLMHFSEPCM